MINRVLLTAFVAMMLGACDMERNEEAEPPGIRPEQTEPYYEAEDTNEDEPLGAEEN